MQKERHLTEGTPEFDAVKERIVARAATECARQKQEYDRARDTAFHELTSRMHILLKERGLEDAAERENARRATTPSPPQQPAQRMGDDEKALRQLSTDAQHDTRLAILEARIALHSLQTCEQRITLNEIQSTGSLPPRTTPPRQPGH